MPMDFLRRIEDCSFPLAVRDENDINCAAVLVASDFIEAVLPPPLAGSEERVAVVLRITGHGRAELNQWKDTRPIGI